MEALSLLERVRPRVQAEVIGLRFAQDASCVVPGGEGGLTGTGTGRLVGLVCWLLVSP